MDTDKYCYTDTRTGVLGIRKKNENKKYFFSIIFFINFTIESICIKFSKIRN